MYCSSSDSFIPPHWLETNAGSFNCHVFKAKLINLLATSDLRAMGLLRVSLGFSRLTPSPNVTSIYCQIAIVLYGLACITQRNEPYSARVPVMTQILRFIVQPTRLPQNRVVRCGP